MPIFVGGGIVLMAGFIPFLWMGRRKHAWILVGAAVISLLMLINSLRLGFHIKYVSDLYFLVLFPMSFVALNMAKERLRPLFGVVFALAMAALFLLPFVYLRLSGNEDFREKILHESPYFQIMKPAEMLELSTPESQNQQTLAEEEAAPEPIIMIGQRHYKKGFFRVIHVASYLLGFPALFFAFLAWKRKQFLWFIPAGVLFFLSIYTGARTFAMGSAFALMLYFVQRKYLLYLLLIASLVVLAFIYRYQLFLKLEGSFLQQYVFALFINWEKDDWMSGRFGSWTGWYNDMREFAWYEYLIGRTHFSGILNSMPAHMREATGLTSDYLSGHWYHNDFLTVAHNYGLMGLGFYVGIFIKIYRTCRQAIRGNLFVFVFFVTAIVVANISGFYYYFPIFLMYLFVLMVHLYEEKNEEKKE